MTKPDWEGFGKAVMECWPYYDLDGFDLQDLAEKYGIIVEVPGGYDPEKFEDPSGIAEPGDPFYLRNYHARD